jgi:hypothetical protein
MPDLDIVSVRQVGFATTPDPQLLAWAARVGRVLITHDRNTLVGYAYARVARGEPMPGVIEIARDCPVGRAIQDLVVTLECTADEDWANQVHYIPL